MVGSDHDRQGGRVRLDVRLNERVLVLGVGNEQLGEGVPPARYRDDRIPLSGVDAAGGRRHAEQLRADALVDVAVAVDCHRLEGGGLDGEHCGAGGCGHGSSSMLRRRHCRAAPCSH